MKSHCAILLGLSGLVSAGWASFGEDPSAAAPSPAVVIASAASGFRPLASLILDGTARITDRLWAIDHLGRDLRREQIAELYAFLKALPGPQEKNLAGLNLLKNNLVNLLQDQIHPPAGLTGMLIEIYRDPAQDPVARDYALQHLVTWSDQGAADAPDAQAKIQAALHQAAQENTNLAGTALLGLHRLIASDSVTLLPQRGELGSGGLNRFLAGDAVNGAAISQMALRMLGATNLPSASRVTAIQVCAEREITEALPAIQALAQTDGSTALRISAIAALGWLGGLEQAVLLQRLEAEQNQALRPAIQGALRRLQTKLLNNPALTQNSL